MLATQQTPSAILDELLPKGIRDITITPQLVDELSCPEAWACKPKPIVQSPFKLGLVECGRHVYTTEDQKTTLIVQPPADGKPGQAILVFYNGFLSNFTACQMEIPVRGSEKRFYVPCPEAAFKLATWLVHDGTLDEIKAKLLAAATPAQVKASTFSIKEFNPVDWDSKSVGFMFYIIAAKLNASLEVRGLFDDVFRILKQHDVEAHYFSCVEAAKADGRWGNKMDIPTTTAKLLNSPPTEDFKSLMEETGENQLGKCWTVVSRIYNLVGDADAFKSWFETIQTPFCLAAETATTGTTEEDEPSPKRLKSSTDVLSRTVSYLN